MSNFKTKFNDFIEKSIKFAKSNKNTPKADNVKKPKERLVKQVIAKQISRTRRDIGHWKAAMKAAEKTEYPCYKKLQDLYADIMLDGHLTSQIEIRNSFVTSSDYKIEVNGKDDIGLTDMLREAVWFGNIMDRIINTKYEGTTLIELDIDESGQPVVDLIPRSHIAGQYGFFYPNLDNVEKNIRYRELPEYGTWLLEFMPKEWLGLICKVVPHVILKRFAQQCWGELCEIYGIPPRVLKTDTTNTDRMRQSEEMLRDMGSAAWMIIDTEEVFEFAKGVTTDGDVYDKLINVCKNEISQIIAGAVIGQDTKNGNRSKEEVSMDILKGLIRADKDYLSKQLNTVVFPALIRIGILPEGAKFVFEKEVDLESLWQRVRESMPYVDFNKQWLEDTFGFVIDKIKDNKTDSEGGDKKKLAFNKDDDFFF